METKSYKDLIVWQKSISLVKDIYLVANLFPDTEKFGLSTQLKRAAVSIPSNIAEGYGRSHPKERKQFILMARGSTTEVETQLIIARELGFITTESFKKLDDHLTEILKMLSSLAKTFS